MESAFKAMSILGIIVVLIIGAGGYLLRDEKALNEEKANLEEQIAKDALTIQDYAKAAEDAKNELEIAQQKIHELDDLIKSLQSSVDEGTARISELQNANEMKTQEAQALQQDVTQLMTNLIQARQDYEKIKSEKQILEAQYAGLENEKKESQEKAAQLEEKLSNQQSANWLTPTLLVIVAAAGLPVLNSVMVRSRGKREAVLYAQTTTVLPAFRSNPNRVQILVTREEARKLARNRRNLR